MQAILCALLFVGLIGPAEAKPSVFCELYAQAHFGNWYEVAGEREMREMLAEARHWGYTRYGDWFDTLDCVDPFSGDRQYSLGNALWDHKKAHYLSAQALGFQTDLIITPNHVFRDQLKPAWLAKSDGRVFGQLICPSHPEARQIILDNYRHLFADLAKSGVRLNSVTAAPYDYGGCTCDRCRPWIVTFAELSCEIHRLAETYHPGIELHFIGWWWSPEEHRLFADWMDQNAPGRARSIALHIPYDQVKVADVPLPRGCKRNAFVHIGYATQASPRDVYGHTGPMIAVGRIADTVRNLKAQGVAGVVAYSEGIFDDVNKVLLGRLWADDSLTDEEILAAYARRYFAADESQARAWVDWLMPWGTPFVHDAVTAREKVHGLSGDQTAWRRRQWVLKADMFVAHQTLAGGSGWTAERLARVEDFRSAYERLNRQVYGLGPLRHSLGPDFIDLPWYKDWLRYRKASTKPADTPPAATPEP